jgi:uncharacterized beta-barrel protein YwiB (DUF1934 family)
MIEKVISVKTDIEYYDETPKNSIEMMFSSTHEMSDTGEVIRYEESEISGMDNTKTVLVVCTDGSVELYRIGANDMSISFSKGNSFFGKYSTPYGDFDMEVRTKSLDISKVDGSVKDIFIDYTIELKGLTRSKNRMRITVL